MLRKKHIRIGSKKEVLQRLVEEWNDEDTFTVFYRPRRCWHSRSRRTSASLRQEMMLNEAGGLAYGLDAKTALAQYAATGCLGQTFYASAENQAEVVLLLAESVGDEFLAKVAIYARTKGYMKDMPALLCALLAARKSAYLPVVFPKVIDNGKMLRNFVQIVRSGRTGRKSFGSAVRRLIREWFASRTDKQVFCAAIGNTPTMSDILRMVHPRPETPQRRALYGYILGKEYVFENLPEIVQEFEAFKKSLGK